MNNMKNNAGETVDISRGSNSPVNKLALNKKPANKSSVSRKLLIELVIVVSFVSFIVTLFSFLYLSGQSEAIYGKKSRQYIVYLRDSLELPLWNIDQALIRQIAASFAANQEIGYLHIQDDKGTTLFEKPKLAAANLILSQTDILHKGTHIGSIQLGVTSLVHDQMRQQLLLAGIATMLLVIAALFFSLRILFRKALEQPLKALVARTEDLSAGHYQSLAADFEYREFEVISNGLSRLATQVEHRESSLRAKEARFRYMLETSPIAVRIAKSGGHEVVFSNQRYDELINIGATHGIDPMLYYAHPQDYEDILQQLARGEKVFDRMVELSIPNFGIKWVLASYFLIEYEADSAVMGWLYDITDRKIAESERRIAATTFESQEGMIVTDANSVILRINQAFTNITGYSAEEATGKTPNILKSELHDKQFFDVMWNSLNTLGTWSGEMMNKRKNGEVYPGHVMITAVKDVNGAITNYVATLTDSTSHKVAEERIQSLAFYDPLTALPNRRLFIDRLKQALAVSMRSRVNGALLFIDLDHFKSLNDTLGHDTGDLLLQQVAERLVTCVREGDTVARLGGDEFVILLEDLSEHALEAAAQTEIVGEKILRALNLPYALGTHEHQSSPSIGIVLFSEHNNHSLEDLLKHADIAMYQAKKAGRNTLRFFDPHMQDAINIRVDMEKELSRALSLQQFELHYQIQVDNNAKPIGAEALIRWRHPERGMISPFHFIPLAEDTGLILPIGQWVLETACIQLQAWQQCKLKRELVLAVNVSAKQFLEPGFVSQVQTLIKRYDINPERLKLELTESLLADNLKTIIATMHALGEMGIKFSLDDFGTGYSSLQYLKNLPLDQLKIDQSFVREIESNSSDRAIVQTIISMAHSLALEVIAEGVENEAQRQFLIDHGCQHFQGYLFSKPVPKEAFDALFASD